MALRLSSVGYGGGDPERVLKMRADLVLKALAYENMKGDYEEVYIELNREK